MSDGGEGFREAFDGDVITVDTCGPFGSMVEARMTIADSPSGSLGIFEVADVVGRGHLAHPSSSQALSASSEGVGHMILAAAQHGVDAVLFGCGGSATSDGGLGCYRVLKDAGGLPLPVTAATDVTARFSGARRYAEQKGVAPSDLHVVDERLNRLRDVYLRDCGIDVELVDRTGAAGGIPGAIAALGGVLTSGFDAVAGSVDLPRRIERASLVITGEGRFDEGSLEGKVAVGVASLAPREVPVLVVCGSVDAKAAGDFQRQFPNATLYSLAERFGIDTALADVLHCVEMLVGEELQRRLAPRAAAHR